MQSYNLIVGTFHIMPHKHFLRAFKATTEILIELLSYVFK